MDKSLVISSRYRSLILSVIVFLMLIFLLLIFTYFTSNQLERNAALINTTNRAAIGAQEVIKDLFSLENTYGQSIRSPYITRVNERLEDTTEMMNDILAKLETGGVVIDPNGYELQVTPVSSELAIKDLQEARKQWSLLEPKIQKYLAGAGDIMIDSSDDLTQAADQAKTSSLLIVEALEELVDSVYEDTKQQANQIRMIQLIGVAIIFAYFIVFIFFFIRRLGAADSEAMVARRETEEIMETVNTGLFLLDKDLVIGNQHSKALADIMGTSRLGGESLTTVLRNRISDKDLETTRQFIEQLYNPRVKSKLVNDLNPLNKVMLHSDDGNNATDRYLDFNFSRVYENKNIARILVNVSDVSEAVRLEKRLEKEREQNDLQIEMLTTILNVSPKLIHEFISNTNRRIASINSVLRNPGSSQFELEAKLKSIYREMHSLKGEASALKLHSFTQIANEAEDKLQRLQNQGRLSGNDFLPLTIDLDDLLNLTNTISALGQRINQATDGVINIDSNESTSIVDQIGANQVGGSEISQHKIQQRGSISTEDSSIPSAGLQADDTIADNTSREREQDMNKYYQDFVSQIATRQNKSVNLITSGLDMPIPDRLQETVKEIAIQLIRNTIVHGIELPSERKKKGKSMIGQVKFNLKHQSNYLVMVVEDDGAGIDYPAIKRRLVELGRFSSENVQSISKGRLLNALFSSGFSTKKTADEDGGRGVGLDIIRDRVKNLDGKINVHSEEGKMTRFTIGLPVSEIF